MRVALIAGALHLALSAMFRLVNVDDRAVLLDTAGNALAGGLDWLFVIAAFHVAHRLADRGGAGMKLVIGATIAVGASRVLYMVAYTYLAEGGGEQFEAVFDLVEGSTLVIQLVVMLGWAIAGRSAALGLLGVVAVVVGEGNRLVCGFDGDAAETAWQLGQLAQLVAVAGLASLTMRRPPRDEVLHPAEAMRLVNVGLRDVAHGLWIVGAAAIAVVAVVARISPDHVKAAAAGFITAATLGMIAAMRLGLGAAAFADERGASGWLAAVATLFAVNAAMIALWSVFQVLQIVLGSWSWVHDEFAAEHVTIAGAAALAALAAVAAAAVARRGRGLNELGNTLAAACVAGVVLAGYAAFAVWSLDGSAAREAKLYGGGMPALAAIAAAVALGALVHHAGRRFARGLPEATLREAT